MLVKKLLEYDLFSVKFDEIIYGWFFGGKVRLTFSSTGAKTILFYGYDNITQSNVFLGSRNVSDGASAIVQDIAPGQYRSLNIKIDSEWTMTRVTYRIFEEFDRLENNEVSTGKTQIIDSDVLYGDIVLKQRAITFRVPKDLKEIAQSLFDKKVYLDDELVHIKSVSPFAELDIYNWVVTIKTEEVINV